MTKSEEIFKLKNPSRELKNMGFDLPLEMGLYKIGLNGHALSIVLLYCSLYKQYGYNEGYANGLNEVRSKIKDALGLENNG